MYLLIFSYYYYYNNRYARRSNIPNKPPGMWLGTIVPIVVNAGLTEIQLVIIVRNLTLPEIPLDIF